MVRIGMAYPASDARFDATGLGPRCDLEMVGGVSSLRQTPNTIGSGLGLNAASRKQVAAAKAVDIVAELAALDAKAVKD